MWARCYEEEGAAEKTPAVKRAKKRRARVDGQRRAGPRRRALQKRSKAHQRGPVAPHLHLARQGAPSGAQAHGERTASRSLRLRRWIRPPARRVQGEKIRRCSGHKGARKAGVRRKDGIAAGDAPPARPDDGPARRIRRPSGRAGFGRRRPPGTERGDPAVNRLAHRRRLPSPLGAGCAQRAARPSETFRLFAIGRGGSHAALPAAEESGAGAPSPKRIYRFPGLYAGMFPVGTKPAQTAWGRQRSGWRLCGVLRTKEKEFPFWPNHTMQILAVLQRA